MSTKLRILCVYYDGKDAWLGQTPDTDLPGHCVKVAGTLIEAIRLIEKEKNGIMPFDIVLSDASFPNERVEPNNYWADARDLSPHINDALIRGHGIFLPNCEGASNTDGFLSKGGFTVTVSRTDCWTKNRDRDWEKLLWAVVSQINKIDSACTRP